MSEISLLKERRSFQDDRFYKYLAPNGAKAGMLLILGLRRARSAD